MQRDLLPTTSYAILGLLADGPMSGHRLSTMADQSIAHFWSIPRSLVYRELGRLEELGYLSGADVAQLKLPDKREYRLTESGRTELSRWLNQPGFERGRFKDGFLVKFFFGRHIDPPSRTRLVEEYRAQAEAYLEDLKGIAKKLESIEGAEFPRLTALRGIRAAEGQLRWVEDFERMIVDNPALLGAPAQKGVER
ncbi:MAG TPA: PadR family transcriptional regulator [Actinomycetota bacterium]|nr:PadR family transcriptional regulator [Actinomycetota bacterium]